MYSSSRTNTCSTQCVHIITLLITINRSKYNLSFLNNIKHSMIVLNHKDKEFYFLREKYTFKQWFFSQMHLHWQQLLMWWMVNLTVYSYTQLVHKYTVNTWMSTYRYSRCGSPRKASSSIKSNELAVNNLQKEKMYRITAKLHVSERQSSLPHAHSWQKSLKLFKAPSWLISWKFFFTVTTTL